MLKMEKNIEYVLIYLRFISAIILDAIFFLVDLLYLKTNFYIIREKNKDSGHIGKALVARKFAMKRQNLF